MLQKYNIPLKQRRAVTGWGKAWGNNYEHVSPGHGPAGYRFLLLALFTMTHLRTKE